MSLFFDPELMWTRTGVAGYGLVSPGECDLILSHIPGDAGPDFRVLEIGAYCGSTGAYILDQRPEIQWLGVDIFRADPAFAMASFLENRRNRIGLNCFIGTAGQWLRAQGGPGCRVEMAIVDGEHTEEACASDLKIATHVAPTVLVHDYGVACLPGVTKAVDEFPGWQIAGRKRTMVVLKPETEP